MWKDFLYFTKSERRGLVVLIVSTVIVSAGIVLYAKWNNPVSALTDEDSLKEYYDFMASIHDRDCVKQYEYQSKQEDVVVLAPFDPNTSDSSTFIRMGLKSYIARNILRYRAKGGTFATPESFARIYGITPEQFKTLLPYIYIGEEYLRKKDTIRMFADVKKDTLRQFKYPAGTVIDLNEADTTELKKIPGIGSGIARMIIGYRTRLGGYYEVEQLQELTHVPDAVNKWFNIQKAPIHRMNLNKWSIERLKSHPYINFYQAKVIVEYRKKRGDLKSLKQLALYDEFSSDDLERIAPYVCF